MDVIKTCSCGHCPNCKMRQSPEQRLAMHFAEVGIHLRSDIGSTLGKDWTEVRDKDVLYRQSPLRAKQCKNGHPWQKETTSYRSNGTRRCMLCHKHEMAVGRNRSHKRKP